MGYNFVGVGANGGVSVKLLAKNKNTPIITAMYGNNGVNRTKIINWEGRPDERIEIYKGYSLGAGGDFKMGKDLKNKLTVMLLVPFRESSYYETSANLPFTFSMGFNVGF